MLLPVLKSVLHDLPPLDIALTIDRTGYFAKHRIAWVGLREVPPPLLTLHAALNRLLESHGIVFDRRTAFKPHLTLARDAPSPPDMPITPIHWPAGQVALVQSRNENGALRYRVLAARA